MSGEGRPVNRIVVTRDDDLRGQEISVPFSENRGYRGQVLHQGSILPLNVVNINRSHPLSDCVMEEAGVSSASLSQLILALPSHFQVNLSREDRIRRVYHPPVH